MTDEIFATIGTISVNVKTNLKNRSGCYEEMSPAMVALSIVCALSCVDARDVPFASP